MVKSISFSLPETTKRPLILVYNGYRSHFYEDIVTKVISLNIIMDLLPSNEPPFAAFGYCHVQAI
jgi:hypothetical protein